MDEVTQALNLVIYLVAQKPVEGRPSKHHFMGGHGYTYSPSKEGKKKLAKDVPTSSGYYTGNPQRPNTVVIVDDIVSLVVPNANSYIDSLLSGFKAVMELVIKSNYKNVWIVTPHKELEAITKSKPVTFEGNGMFKLGKTELTAVETANAISILADMAVINEDPDRNVYFDYSGSAEGGMGNRIANKQLETAEMFSMYSKETDIALGVQSRKDYENPEVDFNKIVTGSRWFFDTHEPDEFFKERHGYRLYNFGRIDPDKNYYGKLTPDVTYSQLYTKRPIEILDKLFDFTVKRIENQDGLLSAGDLSHVISKDVARLVDTIPAVKKEHRLISPFLKQGNRPVLIELIKPTMMSYRIRDFLLGMDVIMHAWQHKDENNKYGHSTFYDITDQIYLKEVNGKGVTKVKVQPTFNQLKNTFNVNVEHRNSVKPVPIMLSVGYDMPERNSFNSVEDPTVQVWVVTDTMSDRGLRYSTLVITEEFIYIHTSAAANLRVLTVSELGKKS